MAQRRLPTPPAQYNTTGPTSTMAYRGTPAASVVTRAAPPRTPTTSTMGQRPAFDFSGMPSMQQRVGSRHQDGFQPFTAAGTGNLPGGPVAGPITESPRPGASSAITPDVLNPGAPQVGPNLSLPAGNTAGGTYQTPNPERDKRVLEVLTGVKPRGDGVTPPPPVLSTKPIAAGRQMVPSSPAPIKPVPQLSVPSAPAPAPTTTSAATALKSYPIPTLPAGALPPSSGGTSSLPQLSSYSAGSPLDAYSVPIDQLSEPDPNRALNAIMYARANQGRV